MHISFNQGVDWLNTNKLINYYDNPTFTNVIQNSYNPLGGFTINIIGNNFYNSNNYLACIYQDSAFNKYKTLAKFINENNITCLAPSDFGNQKSLNLFISYNSGLELINTGISLLFKNLPSLYSLFPISEYMDGGNTIDIQINNNDNIVTPLNNNGFCKSFKNGNLLLDKNLFCKNLANDEFPFNSNNFFNYSTIEISYNKIDFSEDELLHYRLNITFNNFSPLLVK